MRAAPATIGGMPRSSKRASERQSDTSSRSPCTTWMAIAVWPSLKVVKSCARAVGMVLLRGMMRSTSPPMVSSPSESGITSSSSSSSAPALPASALAWMAAPSATTSSGFRLVSGVRPNSSPTAACTRGMRVEPPTITTPCTSSLPTLASRSTLRTAASVRATSGSVSAKNSSRVMRTSSSPLASGQASVAWSAPESFSLAARAAASTARLSCAVTASRPARCSACAASMASKSSPPSAESPPVATTSNTPAERRSSEMSKVPPPRS